MNLLLRTLLRKIATPSRVLFSVPMRLLSAPRAILGLSLPTRVALVVFVCLAVAVSLVFWRYHSQIGSLASSPVLVLVIIGLLLLITLLVRQMVKLWLEGPSSEFPDIDAAWNEGLQALQNQGLDLQDLPVFLVHGSEDATHIDTLLKATEQPFRVTAIPSQPDAPLRWYASAEAVYLVLLKELSQLAVLHEAGTAEVARAAPAASMKDVLTQTLNAMDVDAGMMPGKHQLTKTAAGSPTPPAEQAVGMMEPQGGKVDFTRTLQADAPGAIGHAAAAAPPTSGLDSARRARIAKRLRYVCRLLVRARQPLAPANGVLSLLTLELISGRRAALEEVQLAFREDLETLRKSLCLRCPAITLVTGMEEELGFRELIRRIGVERAQGSRFGKGSRVGTPPLADHVEAVAANACAAFEIFAYSLFREEGGISAFGNPKLYALICRMRTELRERIENILAFAYGRESRGEDAAEDALLFAGTYFAATGSQSDLQAFIRGVFSRFVDRDENLQDQLEWTRPAEQEEGWYQFFAQLGYVVDGLLLIVLVLLLVRLIMGA